MKKTSALVAGLLLVSGTIFGMDVKLKHSKLEGTYNFIDSIQGAATSDTQKSWDANLRVQLATEFDLGDYGTVITDLDITKVESERELGLIYKRNYGDFEGSVSSKLIGNREITETIKNTTGTVTGTSTYRQTELLLSPRTDDETTYIKWNILGNKDYSLTYYPWYMETKFDTEGADDAFTGYNYPGLKLDGNIKGLKTSVEFSTIKGTDSSKYDYLEKNYHVATLTLDKTIKGTRIVVFGGTTDLEKEKRLTSVAFKTSGNLTKNLSLKTALNTSKLGNGKEKLIAYGKVSYNLENINSYKPIVYTSLLYKNEAAVSGYTDITNGENKWIDTSLCGDLKEIETGLRLEQGNFSITPKAKVTMREKAAYVKSENENTISKYNFTLGITLAHEVWN